MGKITGFLELQRIQEAAEPANERVRHYREFVLALKDDEAAKQGAEYVDTYTGSAGHDVCRPVGTKWIEGIKPESPGAQVHPNALGQEGMSKAVLAKLG